MASRWILCAVALLLSLTATRGVEYSGPMSEDSVQFERFAHHTHHLAKRQTTPTTTTIEDNHDYYTSRFVPPGPAANSLWMDLSQVDAQVDFAHNISDRFRFFAVHDLMFNFSFYGHVVNSVAITTAGFIYVGTYLHQFIHLTQYIAPLQADFNPSLNETATVLVYGTPERFTIQWDQVYNNDHVDSGPFTFQLTLLSNGEIHFAYREVPLTVADINNDGHPVAVGLADSYYIDRPIPGGFILRTIFEYHRVELADMYDQLAYSAIVLTPLPNCIMAASCDQCVAVSASSSFECGWCDNLQRCSDGIDRHRQEWFTSGCSESSTDSCASTGTTTTTLLTSTSPTNIVLPQSNSLSSLSSGTIVGISVSGIVVLVLVVVLTGMCIGLLVYGYKNPNSKIGLYMIEHRPKARSLNRGSYNTDKGKVNLADC